jgi:hypothetical protein
MQSARELSRLDFKDVIVIRYEFILVLFLQPLRSQTIWYQRGRLLLHGFDQPDPRESSMKS